MNARTSSIRSALGLVSKSTRQVEEAQENDQCLSTALPTGAFAIAHTLRMSDQCCQRWTPVGITLRLSSPSSSSQMAKQRCPLRPVLLLVAEFLPGKTELHWRSDERTVACFQMDPSFVPQFYTSNTMSDYVSLPPPSASTSSLFSTALPSIMSMDPLHSCSPSSSSYTVPFASVSTDLLTNDHEDLWRGSSIAALRRKAVEYQAGGSTPYK